MREAKQLLIASKTYAREFRWRSWWHLWSTLGAFVGLITLASVDILLPLRVLASIFAGLMLVRMFILYHDYQHHAILDHSPVAALVMYLYGILAINPPSIWNRSHDHHHKHNSQILGTGIGSFPLMTTDAYAKATTWQRFLYAFSRNPITIACGYLTVFLYGMCLKPLLASPKKHFDCAVALVLHAGLVLWLATTAPVALVLAVIIPFSIGSGIGAYLFYAQHNYPAVKLRERSEWSHVFAALESSSYIKMSPWMHWFTGNIGYHHVHHLNARIPFYRLPEAMAGIQELQSPGTTSLSFRDIISCLRLKLWDPEQGRLVAFGEAEVALPVKVERRAA